MCLFKYILLYMSDNDHIRTLYELLGAVKHIHENELLHKNQEIESLRRQKQALESMLNRLNIKKLLDTYDVFISDTFVDSISTPPIEPNQIVRAYRDWALYHPMNPILTKEQLHALLVLSPIVNKHLKE